MLDVSDSECRICSKQQNIITLFSGTGRYVYNKLHQIFFETVIIYFFWKENKDNKSVFTGQKLLIIESQNFRVDIFMENEIPRDTQFIIRKVIVLGYIHSA